MARGSIVGTTVSTRRAHSDAAYLLVRRGRYYARRRIPVDLVAVLGESDLTKALGTRSRREAQYLAQLWHDRLQAGFTAIRDGILSEMTTTSIRDWLQEFASRALSDLQQQVDDSLAHSLSRHDADEAAEAFSDAFDVLAEPVHEGEEWAIRAALGMIGQAPEEIPQESWQPAAVAVLRAIKALQFNVHRPAAGSRQSRDDASTSPSTGPISALRAQLDALTRQIEQQGRARHAKTLGEAIEAYEKLKTESGEIRRETLQGNLAKLRRFAEAVGPERELDDIRPDEVRAHLAGLTDEHGKPLAASTKRLHGTKIVALYTFAIENEWATKNPAKGRRPKREGAANEDRKAFTNEQLRRIFGQELVDASRGKGAARKTGKEQPERLWVPLIMLTMGARPNEVAQLQVGEVVEVDGLACLSFDPQDETGVRRLKNPASRRTVPIPRILIDLGLLDYVEQRRAESQNDSQEQLFPALKFNKMHGYAARLITWFNGSAGFLSRIGVREKRLSLYSLRHTFLDRLVDADVNDVVRTDIAGHARSGDQGKVTYISKRSVVDMKRALDRVDWSDALADLRKALGRP